LQHDSYGLSPSGLFKMSNKILIDASHQEEIRVVVTRGNHIEEYDSESEQKKQLKGNIYLARITRVEPSLQAAFIEYGGNRHGFLAFSEIHPDYYQIPIADRLALLEAEERAAKIENENNDTTISEIKQKKCGRENATEGKSEAVVADSNTTTKYFNNDQNDILSEDDSDDTIELVGAEDVLEELPIQRLQRRDYKIQEVIKRRQILLVQVMKEERGNKGAALTTYLSLAGRYSVLMPNTARGGGISRKITNISDRKRLREIVKALSVPKGMGVILRTAGANRTKAEIKRDYEYLMRLWDNVRNLTLNSIAPTLVYEESSLIKRSIRDLYNKSIDEILVAGEKGYREAKDFMRMLMPSYAKIVQPYRDKLPIFACNGIEIRLDNMLQPEVSLKSGGYLVINQTEALVAIDVNSGRSTKEHSVEETAVRTNLEAAEEVARQLRLRDLSGLIVIDFIDMLEKCNVRAVEKKLKDRLKEDRARIQVGRISHFGLMEMSRQRIRASVLESTTYPCPHCIGSGYIRSKSSIALHIIRSIEEYLLRNGDNNITVRTPVNTALYVLNHKRKILANLEERFGLTIDIEADDTLGSQHFAIYKGQTTGQANTKAASLESNISIEPEIPSNERTNTENATNPAGIKIKKLSSLANNEEDRKRRRRRGRRSGKRNRECDYDIDCRLHIADAEPVGSFAKSAIAEFECNHNDSIVTTTVAQNIKQERRARKREITKDLSIEKDKEGNKESGKTISTTDDVVTKVLNVIKPDKRKIKRKISPISTHQKTTIKKEIILMAQDVDAVEKPHLPCRKQIKTVEPVVTSSTDDKIELKPKKTGWWQRKGSFFD